MTAAAAACGQTKKIPVGVQLYTVRNLMKKDPDATLGAIAEIGYRVVEGGRAELIGLQPLLRKYKLTTPSVSVETALITGNWKVWGAKEVGWDQTIADLKTLGAKYAVVPYLMVPERKDIPKFIEQMNTAGERFAAAGMAFCYHNHAFEFGGEQGKRPIDLMLSGFSPKTVFFEADVFWISIAGQDPAEFLKKHGKRVKLVHLKDKMAGAPVQFNESVKPPTFKEVGSGSLDFKAILKAAEKAGVEHYMVEQDQTEGNPIDSLRKSWAYLKSIGAV
jgi:sugar phosphate isomerase/epimerase